MSETSPRLRLISLALGAAVLVTLVFTGCVVYRNHPYGPSVYTVHPPPRSAKDGYVHPYRDVVLVFDRSWNGYLVRGHPHHYFFGDHYYRWKGGRWQTARNFKGPWVSVQLRALPMGLHEREVAEASRAQRHKAVVERREERREAAREKREERRQAVEERREERRQAAQERREAAREKREDLRRAAEERREVAKEKRDERREVVKEKREERRQAVKEKREERREVSQEKRAKRREVAKSAKLRRKQARGGTAAPETADEEVPANLGVE